MLIRGPGFAEPQGTMLDKYAELIDRLRESKGSEGRELIRNIPQKDRKAIQKAARLERKETPEQALRIARQEARLKRRESRQENRRTPQYQTRREPPTPPGRPTPPAGYRPSYGPGYSSSYGPGPGYPPAPPMPNYGGNPGYPTRPTAPGYPNNSGPQQPKLI